MPQDYSDILSVEEVKLIRKALKRVYKDKLYDAVEDKAGGIEKKHPLGTHGSIQAYCKGDGFEIENTVVEEMKMSKDNKIASLGNRIFQLMLSNGVSVIHSGDTKADSTIRTRLVALEDSSPMASSFQAARKLQQSGRDSR